MRHTHSEAHFDIDVTQFAFVTRSASELGLTALRAAFGDVRHAAVTQVHGQGSVYDVVQDITEHSAASCPEQALELGVEPWCETFVWITHAHGPCRVLHAVLEEGPNGRREVLEMYELPSDADPTARLSLGRTTTYAEWRRQTMVDLLAVVRMVDHTVAPASPQRHRFDATRCVEFVLADHPRWAARIDALLRLASWGLFVPYRLAESRDACGVFEIERRSAPGSRAAEAVLHLRLVVWGFWGAYDRRVVIDLAQPWPVAEAGCRGPERMMMTLTNLFARPQIDVNTLLEHAYLAPEGPTAASLLTLDPVGPRLATGDTPLPTHSLLASLSYAALLAPMGDADPNAQRARMPARRGERWDV